MQITTTEIDASWPLSIYAQRREKLRALLAAENLDVLLVAQAVNRFYLSGFELHDGQPGETSGYLLICRDGNDWLATDSRFLDAAARLWPKDRICIYKPPVAKAIASLLSRLGAIIGVDARGISWNFARELAAFCKIPFIPAGYLVEKLRQIKEPREIAALKRSFQLNHQLLDWLRRELDADHFTGITEAALAWEIEKYFRQNGAQELAFAVIAAAGRNGALPHAVPGEDLIEKNGSLLADVGCRVDNYCSDQTRTFWLGDSPSPQFAKALSLTREAQEAALAAMRPGIDCAKVYQIARSVFEKAGVAAAFTHGLGHGVGLATHEAPSLSPSSKQKLEEGMVVTVEPGLYYPEWGGVRWENTVLVEKDGVALL